ncbi:MAG: hypothetical protein ACFB9M_10480 [Myxococcota bacterium]
MVRSDRRFVQRLVESGYQSPYLDRLRLALLDPDSSQSALEVELAREVACALGRAGAKVDMLLLKTELARSRYDEASTDEARREAAREHNDLRKRAEAARLDLKIHREAAGVRRNQMVDRLYPLPPPLPAD